MSRWQQVERVGAQQAVGTAFAVERVGRNAGRVEADQAERRRGIVALYRRRVHAFGGSAAISRSPRNPREIEARKPTGCASRARPTAVLKGEPPTRASSAVPVGVSAIANTSIKASPQTMIMAVCMEWFRHRRMPVPVGAPRAPLRSAPAARPVSPTAAVGAEGEQRIVGFEEGVGGGNVHHAVLVGVGQFAAVPAARALRRTVQAGWPWPPHDAPRSRHSRKVGTMNPGIFEKPSIATRWLVSRTYGLPNRVENDVAVGRQVDRARVLGRVEAGDDVVGDVVEGHAPDRRHRQVFVDEVQALQRAGPGDTTVCRIENSDLRLFMGVHRVDHLDADRSQFGRPAMKWSSITHWMKLFGHHCRAVDSTGCGANAVGHVGRRARRDAVDHAARATGVGLDPGAQRGLARGVRGSRAGQRESRVPLLRRLSQLSSVTGAPPRFSRSRRMRGQRAIDRACRRHRPGRPSGPRGPGRADAGCRGSSRPR